MNKHAFSKSLIVLSAAFTIESCKSTHNSALRSEVTTSPSVEATNSKALDLNDVSILVKRPGKGDRGLYLGLDEKTSEGPILTEEQFAKLGPMLRRTKLLPYSEWKMAGVRFDNCGKLLPQLPCLPQIRLVYQPLYSGIDLAKTGVSLNPTFINEGAFGDAALHLAFDVGAKADEMYRDVANLKAKFASVPTSGMLTINPVLEKEGMDGNYARELNRIIRKYALPSTYDRIAIMGTEFNGGGAVWEFAATTEIKKGQFSQTPLPCQNPKDKTNIFETISKPLGMVMGELTPSVGCADRDINELINGKEFATVDSPLASKAMLIDNPEVTAFASTNCVSCHKAGRLLGIALSEEERATLTKTTKDAFKIPLGVSTTKAEDELNFLSAGMWDLRAFGFGESGASPGISQFTLNDSMRVAHELNVYLKLSK